MKVRNIIYTILLLGIIGGCVWVWFWIGGEAEGTVHTGVAQEKMETVKNGTEVFRENYFTIAIPREYSQRNHTLPESGPLKETLFLVGAASGNEKVAISVEERPEKNFEASPGFQLRKEDRDYLSKKIQNGDQEIILFTKLTDPFEKTIYFFQEDFLVSISYTATAENKEAEGQILQMQKTFKILSIEERQNQQKNQE